MISPPESASSQHVAYSFSLQANRQLRSYLLRTWDRYESRCSWFRGTHCSRSRLGARGYHHRIIKQQFELVAQAHGSRDALALLRCIVAGQHKRIDGHDLLPDLLVHGKEGDLLGA